MPFGAFRGPSPSKLLRQLLLPQLAMVARITPHCGQFAADASKCSILSPAPI
jgi:hypothetical protein